VPKTKKTRGTHPGSSVQPHRHPDDTPSIADPDDWGLCGGHPPRASAGFVGCSPTWPPPAEVEPRYACDRLAEESAEYGSLEIALAFAKLERRLAAAGGPQ
jgi:hypothetical protein